MATMATATVTMATANGRHYGDDRCYRSSAPSRPALPLADIYGGGYGYGYGYSAPYYGAVRIPITRAIQDIIRAIIPAIMGGDITDHHHCDGAAGALIGGVAGALIGREIDRSVAVLSLRRDGTTGLIVGGALGAVVGNEFARDC